MCAIFIALVSIPYLDALSECTVNGQLYPVQDQCTKYYDCQEVPVVLSCPEGQYFDCLTQTCGTNVYYVCCGNDRSMPSFNSVLNTTPCKEGTTVAFSYGIYKCVNGSVVQSTCPDGTEFCDSSLHCYNASSGPCDARAALPPTYTPTDTAIAIEVGLASFETCPSDYGIYNIADNCTSYYNCTSGSPFLYSCPEGYVFDCFNEVCSTKTYTYCCKTAGSYSIIANNVLYSCKNYIRQALSWFSSTFYFTCSDNQLFYSACDSGVYCNLTDTCTTNDNCKSTATTSTGPTTITTSVSTNSESVSTENTSTNSTAATSTESTSTPSASIDSSTTESTSAGSTSSSTESSSAIPTSSSSTTNISTLMESTSISSTASTSTGSTITTSVPVHNLSTRSTPTIRTAPSSTIIDDSIPVSEIPVSTVPTTIIMSTETSKASTTSVSSKMQCMNRFSSVAVWNNCSQFMSYNKSSATIYTCEGNKTFNGFKKCCVDYSHAFVGSCDGDPNKPTTSNTSCSYVGRNVEHPSVCNLYFTCNEQHFIKKNTCPTNQMFDWEQKICVDVASSNMVPTCSMSKYVKCIQSSTWKRIFCNVAMYFPGFLFRNASNDCKSIMCKYIPFI